MTTQEIFDRVAGHLMQQGKRSAQGNGCCMYRGPDNLKCAAGCLIDDEFYCVAIEHNSVRDTIVKDALQMSLGRELDGNEMRLLCELQEIHDSSSFSDWYANLEDVAEDYCLCPDILKKYKEVQPTE